MTRSNAIERYLNERLPRYTSYPTAPHFSATAVGPLSYRDWLRTLPGSARLSLYLHVPFCETLCWYCGCNTSVTSLRAPVERYAVLLAREIEMVAGLTGRHRVAHVHWGGGTPTIVGPDLLRSVTALLRDRFEIERGAEIAMEVDPRRLEPEMAEAMAQTGTTRASLGVQTFNPETQKAIARVQSLETTARAIDLLRGAGIAAINLDILYGLPHESVETSRESAAAMLSLNPSRIAVFGYAHVPAMLRHQRVIDARTLPGAAERLAQEQAISEALVAGGYVRIGLDHYARPGDRMARAAAAGRLRRNFQGYTDDPADALIGFGASSIGQLPQGHVQNATGLKEWGDRIEAGMPATVRGVALTPEDRLRARIIERLMCDLRADIPAILWDMDFPSAWLASEMAALGPLIADGLARNDDGVITVPEHARSLVRRVASVFDAYLDPGAGRHAVAV